MGVELGEADSTFRTINNIKIHIKARVGTLSAAGSAPMGVHCYHGFGANLWSWSLVQERLAKALDAVVTSHDMPGFGLTQRWAVRCRSGFRSLLPTARITPCDG